MAEKQMCLACNVNPALPGSDTVPLCASCKALAGNPRGVTYTKPESRKDPPEQDVKKR